MSGAVLLVSKPNASSSALVNLREVARQSYKKIMRERDCLTWIGMLVS